MIFQFTYRMAVIPEQDAQIRLARQFSLPLSIPADTMTSRRDSTYLAAYFFFEKVEFNNIARGETDADARI